MTETTTRTTEEEMAVLDEEIRSMEAELAEREQTLVWGEASAEELVRKEQRRGVLPRLIVAARIRRAELRIERERQAAEGLEAEQAAAYGKMQRAEVRERKAHEDLMAARSEWSGVHTRLEKIRRRIKDAEREIVTLREGR